MNTTICCRVCNVTWDFYIHFKRYHKGVENPPGGILFAFRLSTGLTSGNKNKNHLIRKILYLENKSKNLLSFRLFLKTIFLFLMVRISDLFLL